MKATDVKAGVKVRYRCRTEHYDGFDCGMKEGVDGLIASETGRSSHEVWVQFRVRGQLITEKVPIIDLELATND